MTYDTYRVVSVKGIEYVYRIDDAVTDNKVIYIPFNEPDLTLDHRLMFKTVQSIDKTDKGALYALNSDTWFRLLDGRTRAPQLTGHYYMPLKHTIVYNPIIP